MTESNGRRSSFEIRRAAFNCNSQILNGKEETSQRFEFEAALLSYRHLIQDFNLSYEEEEILIEIIYIRFHNFLTMLNIDETKFYNVKKNSNSQIETSKAFLTPSRQCKSLSSLSSSFLFNTCTSTNENVQDESLSTTTEEGKFPGVFTTTRTDFQFSLADILESLPSIPIVAQQPNKARTESEDSSSSNKSNNSNSTMYFSTTSNTPTFESDNENESENDHNNGFIWSHCDSCDQTTIATTMSESESFELKMENQMQLVNLNNVANNQSSENSDDSISSLFDESDDNDNVFVNSVNQSYEAVQAKEMIKAMIRKYLFDKVSQCSSIEMKPHRMSI